MSYLSKECGNKIKEFRKKSKVSQKQLALLLDKSERTIQKYESGEIDISLNTLELIASKLNIPLEKLLGFNSNSSISTEYNSLSDIISQLFNIDDISELNFNIYIQQSTNNNYSKCLFSINDDSSGEYNKVFCEFLNQWKSKICLYNNKNISKEELDLWKKDILEKYSTYKLGMVDSIQEESKLTNDESTLTNNETKLTNKESKLTKEDAKLTNEEYASTSLMPKLYPQLQIGTPAYEDAKNIIMLTLEAREKGELDSLKESGTLGKALRDLKERYL